MYPFAVFKWSNNCLLKTCYNELKCLLKFCHSKIVSEYDQEIPQSQTADNPMAP